MIRFLPLEVKDVDEFRKCEARCFEMKTSKEVNYILIPLINFGWCYKAIDEGKIIGGLISFQTDTSDIYIHSLFVLPSYRKKQIATSLMNMIMERFSGSRFVLEVNPKHKKVVAFYKKLGFKVFKRVKNYFLDGEDRYIMVYGEKITL